MLMRAGFSAVPTGRSFFSLLQDGCFLVKWVSINERSLARGNANSRKAFNYTKMWQSFIHGLLVLATCGLATLFGLFFFLYFEFIF